LLKKCFTEKRQEVDFFWLDHQSTKNLVQVSFSLDDSQTKKREVTSLSQAMNELSLQAATIVTMDDEDTIEVNGKKIEVVPAWKYLLTI